MDIDDGIGNWDIENEEDLKQQSRFCEFFNNSKLSDRTLVLSEDGIENTSSNADLEVVGSWHAVSTNSDEMLSQNDGGSKIGTKRSFEMICDGNPKLRLIPVHSVILCAESEFFESFLWKTDLQENIGRELQIHLKSGETDTFLHMLELLYNQKRIHIDEEEGSICNIDSFIHLLQLTDRFLCHRLLSSLIKQYNKFQPTKFSSVNSILGFVSFTKSSSSALSKYERHWIKPCTHFIRQHIIPLEGISSLNDVADQVSLDTLKFILSCSNAALDVNNLLTFASLVIGRSDCKALDVEEVLTICSRKGNVFDANFLRHVITSDHSLFSRWSGFQDWFIKALQNYIEFGFQSQEENLHYNDFAGNPHMWPTMQFKLLNSSYEHDHVLVPDERKSQLLSGGYILCIESVTANKSPFTKGVDDGHGKETNIKLNFQACVSNLKSEPHYPIKFSMRCFMIEPVVTQPQAISTELSPGKKELDVAFEFVAETSVRMIDFSVIPLKVAFDMS